MDPEEEQRRGSSSTPLVNGRALLRTAKFFGKFVKTAGAGQFAAIVVGTSVVLGLFTVLFLFGGLGGGGIPGTTATEEQPSGEVESEESPTVPNEGTFVEPIPPGEVPSIDWFLGKFTVYDCFGGCKKVGKDNEKAIYAWNLLKIPLSSGTYTSKLTGSGNVPIWFYPRPHDCDGIIIKPGGTCGGAIDGGLKLWGYWEVKDLLRTKVSIVHESGHLIMQKSGGISQSKLEELAREDGVSCYTYVGANSKNPTKYHAGYYINTYANKNNGVGGGPESESFAEMVGMNVMCGPGSSCDKGLSQSKTINDYPNTCKNTYEWVRITVFGGTDFFGLAPSTPALQPLRQ